jgi:GT2 family glycosyltransferase
VTDYELAATVVVPTRDSHALLAHAVASLVEQDFPRDRYEVLVVDDGSSPPVDRGLERDADPLVRVLRHDEPKTLNAARNTGAREARGELVCYVDDDVEAPPTWLAELVAGAARHPDADLFAGNIRLRMEGEHPRVCPRCRISETKLNLQVEGPIEGRAFGANMTIRRRAFDRIGFFPEDQPIYYDETGWQERYRAAGGVVFGLPDAWLWHRRTPELLRLRNLMARRFRFGYGLAAYREAKGEPLRARDAAARIPRFLAHGVRHRCAFGALAASEQLGILRWQARRR